MTQPDDRELEQYLEGGSKLSRRYRDASSESAPPELDEAILARARAELKRKPPSLNRILTPVALAASVVLGVNLAWNLYQVEPVPEGLRQPQAKAQSRDNAFAPSPPPPAAPAPAREEKQAAEADALQRRDAELAQQREREQDALSKRKSEERLASSARPAEAPQPEPESQSFVADEPAAGAAAAPSAAMAEKAAPLSEPQKIDRLIAHIGSLQGAVFIRSGKEYGPAEAAKHMQLKRDKAGERCATADAFIRVCASFSSTSGEAYLIRFADGRTRTAEDVLREELARM